MPDLADAMNTWDLALELIHRKGFTVVRHGSPEPLAPSAWEATNGDGHTMAADSPLALLALCDIWSEWGERWKSVDVERWYDQIVDADE